MPRHLIARILAAALALLAPTPAMAEAAVEAFPIVYQSDGTACYRIPSLVTVGSTRVLLAEQRFGIRGRQVCNDDGDISLVVTSSADGLNWSAPVTAVDHRRIGEAMADPASAIHDPDFSTLPASDRMIRAGGQSLVATADGRILLLFAVRYSLVSRCGKESPCINSPENLGRGSVRERYMLTTSRDLGRSWSPPREIHSQAYTSCLDRFAVNPAVAAALRPLLAADRLADAATRARRVAAERLFDRRNAPRAAEKLAALLGLQAADLAADMALVSQILRPSYRIGPGTAVAFPHGGGERIFAPAAPVGFYSDDGGENWTCADSRSIDDGSERQAAYLGDGLLVMTLRQIGGESRRPAHRLFAVSTDGGETWGPDDVIRMGGAPVMRDEVVQSSIIGIPGSDPSFAVHAGIAGGAVVPRPQGGERSDTRNHLTLTRLYAAGGEIMPGTLSPCAAAAGAGAVAGTVIWPDSASYSSMALLDGGRTIALAFEASDDSGPLLDYRAWNESIRYTEVPTDMIGGHASLAVACPG